MSTAESLGRDIGGIFGPLGSRIGAGAGRLFKTITGVGDYKVSSNTLINSLDSLPSFRNLSMGTRVQHREYLSDIITSSTIGEFKVQSIPIQPALLTSFPWLAALAENYQQYQLHGVVYEFKSNSYDALSSTNTASGTVVMATNYNVYDPPFTTKFQMEQTQYTSSAKPSVNLIHPIECAKLETPTSVLYTRSGFTTDGDLRLTDWGNFSIATVGMQGASTNIGELWVTYDITLFKPKLSASTDVADHYYIPAGNTEPGGPTYFGADVDGSRPIKTDDSDMGTTIAASFGPGNAYDTIVWPQGYNGKVAVIVRYDCKSSAVNSISAIHDYALGGGVSPLRCMALTDTIHAFDNEGEKPLVYNGNGCCTIVIFLNVANGGNIVFSGGTNSIDPTSTDLFIVALPQSFGTSNGASVDHSLRVKSKRSLVDEDGDFLMTTVKSPYTSLERKRQQQ